jgi:hypothetical protein
MNLRLVSWAILLSISLGLSSSGCRPQVVSEDQQFQVLFNGYQLVLVDDIPKDTSVENLEIAKLNGHYPLQPKLVFGRIYIFKKTGQVSNETMALKEFPERLSRIGARVTKAPRSSNDLIYLYYGGPIFDIEFEKDGHVGKLFNRVADPKDAGGAREWLILAYM